jgi:membrane-bound lytic murein transglycosylase B
MWAKPINGVGVYRIGLVLVRSCRHRRTRRPSSAQDSARVAAAAGECGCQVKTANRRFCRRHEAAGLRREAIDRALRGVEIVMKRLGGRHFVLDDGAGDPGEIAIEIAS